MPTLSFKVATPIIVGGIFIMISFIAVSYENLNASFYVIFFLLAAYVFLFGFATGQSVASPVKKLLSRANELSRGNLKSRFYAETKDELGQLAEVFNVIAGQLEESNLEKENTKKSVGIKVEAETQSLHETISALEQKVQNRSLEIQRMLTDLEKFKKVSELKEGEVTELKNQLTELKERMGKRAPKVAKEAKVATPEQSVIQS